MFELDPALERDSIKVGEFSLCELRLMNDSQFPWFILVPRRVGVTEIYQLEEEDRLALLAESCLLSETMHDAFSGYKLNIAAIGNKVSQLHMHHVVRTKNDACWPEPVWGKLAAIPYKEKELADILQMVRTLLADDLVFSGDDEGRLYY